MVLVCATVWCCGNVESVLDGEYYPVVVPVSRLLKKIELASTRRTEIPGYTYGGKGIRSVDPCAGVQRVQCGERRHVLT